VVLQHNTIVLVIMKSLISKITGHPNWWTK